MNVWDQKWKENPQAKLDFSTKKIFSEMLKSNSFEGKSTLELGCGSGRLTYLALESGARSSVVVDSSENALALAKSVLAGKEQVQFINHDIETLELPEKADVVFSAGLLEHFRGKKLDSIIQAHRRWAAEKVIFIVPASLHYNNIRMRFAKCEHEYGWQRPFFAGNLKRILRKNDFSILSCKRFFVTYGMKELKSRKKTEHRLSPFESLIGGLLLIEAVPKEQI